jgi:DNA-binding beta-propeller fold protein YncE
MAAAGVAAPEGRPVVLGNDVGGFDDLAYSATLGRVLVAPYSAGAVYLVDPDTEQVTSIPGVSGASITEGAGRIYVADRSARALVVVDPGAGTVLGSVPLSSGPDYVRHAAATDEIWVTEPGSDRIEILSVGADGVPAVSGTVTVPGGPEGVAFDVGRRRAYAHASGRLAVIDVDARTVLESWETGCGASHGIPVVDEGRGLVFAGCATAGGGAILDSDDGRLVAGYETGSGEAILAYSSALGHFYLRGDPGEDVAILGVCDDGTAALLGTARASGSGHGAIADDRGNLWVCDAPGAGLLRFQDPYPAATAAAACGPACP